MRISGGMLSIIYQHLRAGGRGWIRANFTPFLVGRMLLCEDYGVQYWSHENIYIKFSLMTNIDLFMSNLIGLEAKKANIYLVGTF